MRQKTALLMLLALVVAIGITTFAHGRGRGDYQTNPDAQGQMCNRMRPEDPNCRPPRDPNAPPKREERMQQHLEQLKTFASLRKAKTPL